MCNNSEDKNSFCPKSVAELLNVKHRFLIPSYQRGYRWEKKQVEDLLDDMWQFADDKNLGDSYYLQPLVVKDTLFENQQYWEVLDGQQRLTTMLLVLMKVINSLGEEKEFYKDKIYSLRYASRNEHELDFKNPIETANIDSFYVCKAKQVINEWWAKKRNEGKKPGKLADLLLYPAEQRLVKFIWYQVDEKDSKDIESIRIFNRLNKGKIGLTSSELIKALFVLYSKNEVKDKTKNEVKNDDENAQELAINQLVLRWNEMERKFQDNKFWHFLGNDTYSNRMDLLFRFVTKSKADEDKDAAYRCFQKVYDYHKGDTIPKWLGLTEDEKSSITSHKLMEAAWKKTKVIFDQLVAWYENNLTYHYIGFLTSIGKSPMEIYDNLELARGNNEEWKEEDLKTELRNMISKYFKGKINEPDDIRNLSYDDAPYTRNLLLLFNIETCLKGGNTRFDFDKYKTEDWDVEHVFPHSEANININADRLKWLEQARELLRRFPSQYDLDGNVAKEYAEKCSHAIIKATDNGNKSYSQAKEVKGDFENLFKKITEYYAIQNSQKVKQETYGSNDIDNLTLLPAGVNRNGEYRVAPFPFKRYFIIESDKSGASFIPICTRNLFLKYYSNSNHSSSFADVLHWNPEDRTDYVDAIVKTLNDIFTQKSSIENA